MTSVWLVLNAGDSVIAVYASELQARRHAMDSGMDVEEWDLMDVEE